MMRRLKLEFFKKLRRWKFIERERETFYNYFFLVEPLVEAKFTILPYSSAPAPGRSDRENPHFDT